MKRHQSSRQLHHRKGNRHERSTFDRTYGTRDEHTVSRKRRISQLRELEAAQ